MRDWLFTESITLTPLGYSGCLVGGVLLTRLYDALVRRWRRRHPARCRYPRCICVPGHRGGHVLSDHNPFRGA